MRLLPPTRLSVAVVDARGRARRAPGLAAWLLRVAPARWSGQVTIGFVSDSRIRALNRQYRGVDEPTDVLSFPAPDLQPGARSKAHGARSPQPSALSPDLGDIVIATGVARRQARAQGHSEATEWRVLALHGLLHLMGHDHERDGGRMDRIERRLRRRGGLAGGLIERGCRR